MKCLHILIVDDEVEAGEVLAVRLGRRGMKPVFVLSGEDALAHLAEHSVDLVLLDVKMPGMDGLAALGHMRRRHPEVPVILLSGHADMESAAQGMALGAFFYQIKPIEIDALCHKIEDACRQQALASASE